MRSLFLLSPLLLTSAQSWGNVELFSSDSIERSAFDLPLTDARDGWRTLLRIAYETLEYLANALSLILPVSSYPPSYDGDENKLLPFFTFLPAHVASLKIGERVSKLDLKCFSDVSLALKKDPTTGDLSLLVDVHSKKSWFCSEVLVVGTVSSATAKLFVLPGHSELSIRDPYKLGYLHVCYSAVPLAEVVDSMRATLNLAWSEITRKHDDVSREWSMSLIQQEGGMPIPDVTPKMISEEYFGSGDIIVEQMFAGLPAVISVATGSPIGHIYMVLEDDDGELWALEANAPGVIRTPLKERLRQMKRGGGSAVWLPLRDEVREHFNSTLAWEEFERYEGLEYGIRNVIFSWLDTKKDNFPCMRRGRELCLSFEINEIMIGLLNKAAPDLVMDFIGQAFKHRARELLTKAGGSSPHLPQPEEVDGMNLEQVFAALKDAPGGDSFYALPERDTWEYKQTRQYPGGEAKVEEAPAVFCSPLVCRVLRAAGVLGPMGEMVQCAEFTPGDVAELDLWGRGEEVPAEECPSRGDVKFGCQLVGKHGLVMENPGGTHFTVNLRPVSPMMAERCPSMAYNGFLKEPINC